MHLDMIIFLLKGLICCAFIGFSSAEGCNSNSKIKDAGPLVKTNGGYIIGQYVKHLDTEVAAFRGIPFAKAPVGQRRFQKPEPVDPWEGVWRADDTPQPCMQVVGNPTFFRPMKETSEDCLYLNVWVPSSRFGKDNANLPVLVWFYGGWFTSGSSHFDYYDGRVLAARGEAVIVTTNYRVGVFGFLDVGTEDAPGNAGLHDQVLALRWVKDNIHHFGGDANIVTIFGESAGSWSVSLHLVSPLSRNLFHKAILQSGAVYHPHLADTAEVTRSKANLLAKASGCVDDVTTDPSTVAKCLKEINATTLLETAAKIATVPFRIFYPSIGNDFLPKSPIEVMESNGLAPVEIMAGITKDEGTLFMPMLAPDLFSLTRTPKLSLPDAKSLIGNLFDLFPETTRDSIYEAYFSDLAAEDGESIAEEGINSFADNFMVCPTLFLAEKAGSVHFYWFTHLSSKPLMPSASNWIGVHHFADVPYVFGVPTYDTETFSAEDKVFSEDIIEKWMTFARTGHPLSGEKLNDWKKFSASKPEAYELNPKHSGSVSFPRRKACEFWRSVFASV